ncbi:MAG TPA: hypothetical protein VNT79_12155, partial [Phycisphaerae bacterium]|nr:hypothetical protein [Phycisphaerae bacterium]
MAVSDLARSSAVLAAGTGTKSRPKNLGKPPSPGRDARRVPCLDGVIQSLRGAVILETDVNGLGAIRSLAAIRPRLQNLIGVDFTASIGFSSRLCDMRSAPGPHVDDGRALRDFLLQVGEEIGGPLALFPSGDRTVRLICRFREALERRYRVLLPNAASVETLIDKSKFAMLADRTGLLTPRHAIVESRTGAAMETGLRFPLVAKPLNSPGDDPIRRAFKAKLFETPHDWDAYFANWSAGGRLLIQERIVGEDSDIFFYGGVWRDGDPVCG